MILKADLQWMHWMQGKAQINWWTTSGAKCYISALCSEWLWMHHKKSGWKREKLKKERRKTQWKEKGWKDQWTHLRKRKDAWKSSLSVEKGHGGKNNSSEVQLLMRIFLGIFVLLQRWWEVRLVQDQRLPKSAQRQFSFWRGLACISGSPRFTREKEIEWRDWEGERT